MKSYELEVIMESVSEDVMGGEVKVEFKALKEAKFNKLNKKH